MSARADHDHGGRHGRARVPGARGRRRAARSRPHRRLARHAARARGARRAAGTASTSNGSRSRACAARACSRWSRRRFGSRARSLRRSARCAGADPRPCSGWAASSRVPAASPRGSRAGRCSCTSRTRSRARRTGCLAPLATRIFAAFPGSFPGRRDDEVIGNPVRATIVPSDSPRERLLARRAGATATARRRRQPGRTNPESARCRSRSRRSPAERRPEVWHQAGETGIDDARKAYADSRSRSARRRVHRRHGGRLRWADLVVARAGAHHARGARRSRRRRDPRAVPSRDRRSPDAQRAITSSRAGAAPADRRAGARRPNALAARAHEPVSAISTGSRDGRGARASWRDADAAEKLAAACVAAAEARHERSRWARSIRSTSSASAARHGRHRRGAAEPRLSSAGLGP